MRTLESLKGEGGGSGFTQGWRVTREESELTGSGCCEKGPEGSGGGRKAGEEADAIVQVSGRWWWVEEMEQKGWTLRAPRKESPHVGTLDAGSETMRNQVLLG